MSRTINDLELGTSVWLIEDTELVEWFVWKKTGIAVQILRKQAAISKRMHSSNVSVYNGCEADLWLENSTDGFLSRFDADTLSSLAVSTIPTFTYGDTSYSTIDRRCFLPSWGDLFGSETTPTATEPELINNKALYGQYNSVDKKAYNSADAAVVWWLRSASSASSFWSVGTSGSAGNYNSASDARHWLRPLLSVAPATIVSDEGADIIRLLPAGETYAEVEFEIAIGSTVTRPKKAVVKYNATNLTDVSVQICNNYGDATPVWVDATSQGEVTLTNAAKETTNWEVGVKMYGKTTDYGCFDEPVVVLQTE